MRKIQSAALSLGGVMDQSPFFAWRWTLIDIAVIALAVYIEHVH